MHNYSQLNSRTGRVFSPYSLAAKGNSSASFYANLERFASEVEKTGNAVFSKYLTCY